MMKFKYTRRTINLFGCVCWEGGMARVAHNCHTRTQLTISSDLINISDDQLGPVRGHYNHEGTGRPAGRPTGAIVSRAHMSLNLT